MRYSTTLALTALLAAPAVAQTSTVVTGTVQEVSVIGTSELLANFIRATLSLQPGAPLSSVNLRQVEQEVMASGYFKSAVAELRTVAGKDVLVITVTPNPTIKSVDTSGMTFLPADAFKKSLEELLNIAPGATVNTQRLDQAREALAANYTQQGYPFPPSISVTQKDNGDGTVGLTFVVDESAPIGQVKVEGVTLLPASKVTEIFKPVYDAKKFDPQLYYQAVGKLQQAYDEIGIVQAGVDTQNSTLQSGVLTVKVIEAKVTAVDTSDLGDLVLKDALQTEVGQPANLNRLKADVRMLSNLTGKPVGFAIQPNPSNPAQVTVLFGQASVQSGPVKSIQLQGNTLVSSNVILAAIKTKVGDVYTPQLAQEDFFQIRDVYRKAGYEISSRDAIKFEEGTLTYVIREVKLAGYELQWDGAHRTVDRVVTRELPEPGRAFNNNELRAALGRISRLGFVGVTGVDVRSDPQNPENITYIIKLSENNKGMILSPAIAYDSLAGGWSGELTYANPNVRGLGHSFSLTAAAQLNDAGQVLGGNARYSIPWIDLNFADFRKTPTSLSVEAGSSVQGNTAIVTTKDSGPLNTVATDTTPSSAVTPAKGQDTGWDYTVRNTYFGVGLGRRLAPNLTGSMGFGVSYKQYYLEKLVADSTVGIEGDQAKVTVKVPKLDANGNPVLDSNGNPVFEDKVVLVPSSYVTPLVPVDTLTTRINAGLNYDSTDNGEFPSKGVRANLTGAYSFGRQGQDPLNWTEVETGASTYFGFGKNMDKGDGVVTKQQVFAVRANAGSLFGAAPNGAGYYVGGGSSADPSKQLRGIDNGALFGTNYVTASAEYRYDFGIKAGFAQGLYGVLFADAGSAWGNTSATNNFNLYYGIGAGIQLNLGIGGALLPSLRFDYGFSPQTGAGKFYFRLGNFW